MRNRSARSLPLLGLLPVLLCAGLLLLAGCTGEDIGPSDTRSPARAATRLPPSRSPP